MTIRENDFRLNDVSGKWRSSKYRFDEVTFDIIFIVSAILLFDNVTLRPIHIRRYDVSAKRRYDEMTVCENDVAPKTTTSRDSVRTGQFP